MKRLQSNELRTRPQRPGNRRKHVYFIICKHIFFTMHIFQNINLPAQTILSTIDNFVFEVGYKSIDVYICCVYTGCVLTAIVVSLSMLQLVYLYHIHIIYVIGKGWCPGSRRRCPSRRPSAGAVRPLPRTQRGQSSMHLHTHTNLKYVHVSTHRFFCLVLCYYIHILMNY